MGKNEQELWYNLSSFLKNKPFERRKLIHFLTQFDQYVDSRKYKFWKNEKKQCAWYVESDFQARLQRDPAVPRLCFRELPDNCIEVVTCYRIAHTLCMCLAFVRNKRAKEKLRIARNVVEKYMQESYSARISGKVFIGEGFYLDHCYGVRIYGGENVHIGSNVCILNEVIIGNAESNAPIEIGNNCTLCARVQIDSNVLIGDNVKIDADQHILSGTVIVDNETIRTPKKEIVPNSFCRHILNFVLLPCLFLCSYFRSTVRLNRQENNVNDSKSNDFGTVVVIARRRDKLKRRRETFQNLRSSLVERYERLKSDCSNQISQTFPGNIIKPPSRPRLEIKLASLSQFHRRMEM